MTILICSDASQPRWLWFAIQDGARVLIIPADGTARHQEKLGRTGTTSTGTTPAKLKCYMVFVNRLARRAS